MKNTTTTAQALQTTAVASSNQTWTGYTMRNTVSTWTVDCTRRA